MFSGRHTITRGRCHRAVVWESYSMKDILSFWLLWQTVSQRGRQEEESCQMSPTKSLSFCMNHACVARNNDTSIDMEVVREIIISYYSLQGGNDLFKFSGMRHILLRNKKSMWWVMQPWRSEEYTWRSCFSGKVINFSSKQLDTQV